MSTKGLIKVGQILPLAGDQEIMVWYGGKEMINLGGKIVFRHLLYTCNLARRKIRTILALFHNLLIGVIPESDDLVSNKAVIGAIKLLR